MHDENLEELTNHYQLPGTIQLDGKSYNDESMEEALLGVFADGPTHWLRCTNAKLSDQSFELLCAYIERNPHLQHVTLHNCQLNDERMERLGEAISRNPGLCSIDLSQNKLTHYGMHILMPSLMDHPTLDSIDFSSNHFGDKGMEQALPLLSRLETRHLGLRGCNLGGDSAEMLKEQIRKTPYISSLDISGNSMVPQKEMLVAHALLEARCPLVHSGEFKMKGIDQEIKDFCALNAKRSSVYGRLLRSDPWRIVCNKGEVENQRNAMLTLALNKDGPHAYNALREELDFFLGPQMLPESENENLPAARLLKNLGITLGSSGGQRGL